MEAVETSEVFNVSNGIEDKFLCEPEGKLEKTSGIDRLDEKLTIEEKEKIEKLRERIRPLLKPEQQDEQFLVRWLRARKFDLDKAEDMLKKHLQFIKANGLENILETYKPPEAVEYFYTAFLGYDKEGSAVRVLNVGSSDIRGLCCSISKTDCLKYAGYVLESDAKKQREERKNDTVCEKQVYIIDLQGLSWRAIIHRIVVDRAFLLLKSYEANHPERLKVAYIVNAPGFFSFIYNWLKTVLPQSIISKLDIVSREECQSKFSRVMDVSILPASLGGTKRDPDGDPNCPSLYSKPFGEPVPERLVSTDNQAILKNDPEARKVIVEYRNVCIAEKLVSESNSVLQWDFQTVDYDIKMGLRYKKDEDSLSEEIIPSHKVDSHLFPESGSFICENPGIYELVFDNLYSWMTSKELTFKVSLDPPQKDIDI